MSHEAAIPRSPDPADPADPAGQLDTVVEISGVAREFAGRRPILFAPRPPGTMALDGIDLAIPRGARFGIVGESGSGKTTLVRLIAGLDRPTTGRVTVNGRDPYPAGRGVQMVFQDPGGSLDPRMRIKDIVAEPLDAAGDRKDRDDRVKAVLAAVGLDPGAADRYPHQFSGGQRQRISIARAIIADPPVLIADEAVSALDVTVRATVLDLLARIAAERDLTLIFVSHDLSVVRRICDRVAVLQRGRLVETGLVADVFGNPRDEYTRALTDAVPTLAKSLAAARARAAGVSRSRG